MGTERLDREQLNRILDAGRSVVSELDRATLLRRLLDDARELTGARYAALGVLDEGKRELEQFIFTGIEEDMRRMIGDLPRGRGILGELIRSPKPLRLARLGDHPRSYGFPPHHPPMTSFLGVPVMIRGEVFGNLYLTDKEDAPEFDEVDEELLVRFAEWVAIAIDNARNFERAERRRGELERAVRGLQTTASLSRELAGESDPAHALELSAKRSRALLEGRFAAVLLRDGEDFAVAEVAGEVDPATVGRRIRGRGSPAETVLAAGVGDRITGHSLTWFAAAGLDASDGVLAPLVSPERADGVIAVFDRTSGDQPYGADEVVLLESFASAAGAAVAVSTALQHEMRELSIASSETERRRWARELHDETLQELGALKVIAEGSLQAGDPEAHAEALARVTNQIERVIGGVEGLITELRPAALDDLGVQAAIETLLDRIQERTSLEIDADFDLDYEEGRAETRHDPELEATMYRVVQESLNNVIKHAAADRVRIAITEADGQVALTVEDDGRGISANGGGRSGFGLLGMRERVSIAGGEMALGPGPEGGTRVRVILPARRR